MYPLKENSLNYVTKYNFDKLDTLRSYKPEMYLYFKSMYELAAKIEQYCPGYTQAFMYDYIPYLLKRDNTRGFSIAVKDDYNVAGMCLLVNSNNKKAITGLAVEKPYQNLKVATRLMDRSMNLLGTDKPIFTVPEKALPNVKKLISHYNFEFTSINTLPSGLILYRYNEGMNK